MAEVLLQLKQTMVQMKSKNAELEKTIAQMKGEQAAANARIKELEGLREKLGKKAEEAEAALASRKKEQPGSEGNANTSEVKEMKQVVDMKNTQITKLLKQIEEMKSELATVQKKANEAIELNQKIPILHGDLERLKKEKEGLETKVPLLEEKIMQLDREKSVKAQEVLDLKAAVLVGQKEIADLKQEKAKDGTALQNLMAKIAAQEKVVVALKVELRSAKLKGEESYTQLEKEIERGKKLDIFLADARKELEVLKAEMSANSPELSELANLKAKLQTTQNELQRLKETHEAATKDCVKLKAELEEKNQKIEQMYVIHHGEKQGEAMMELLKNQLQQTKQRLDETEKRRRVLEVVNTRLSGEYEAMAKSLEAEKSKPTGVIEKDNIIATQFAHIRGLEEQLKASEDSNKALNAALQQSDQSELLQNVQHSNMVLQNKIGELSKVQEELIKAQQDLSIARQHAEAAQYASLRQEDKIGELQAQSAELDIAKRELEKARRFAEVAQYASLRKSNEIDEMQEANNALEIQLATQTAEKDDILQLLAEVTKL